MKHYVRLNADGTLRRCGHMVNPQNFESLHQMENSEWLDRVNKEMQGNGWAPECQRCERSENAGSHSVRQKSIVRHQLLTRVRKDYLIVGGVLDNICNSACQSCNANYSTKIGSLESRDFKQIDNYPRFWELPLDRMAELDINGGEPTASPNYKKILKNLPGNIKIVRMNTNGSRMIQELEDILKKGITAIVTLSLDGIEQVHDYVRWPIKWSTYSENVDKYLDLRARYKNLHLDFWTSVSCLNINDFLHIQQFAAEKKIAHSWAFIHRPKVLDVRYTNSITSNSEHPFVGQVAIDRDNDIELARFIERQDAIRNINIKDYIKTFKIDPGVVK